MTRENNLWVYGYRVNINIFFVIIISGLFMVLFLFKPLNIKEQKVQEVPLLELEKFKLTELDNKGLLSITEGSKGARYTDKYTIVDLDYTDNTDEFLANIKSNDALYKGDLIKLNGDVLYTREDGFSFQTQKANYNKKTKIAKSETRYVSYMGEHRATGSSIEYDNIRGIIKSKNIVANYKLKER